MIDTEVKGNAASVEEAAHFLSASLAKALDDAADRMPPARRVLEASWRDSSADAYSSVIGRILTAVDKESGIARNAGRKVGEYAAVLRAIQDRMADRRDEATAAGLTVAGMIIKEPAEAAAPDALPANASDAEQQAWQRDTAHYASQVKKIELYNSFTTEIQEDFERFRQWIDTELKGAAEEFNESSMSEVLSNAIQQSPGAAAGFAPNSARPGGRVTPPDRRWRANLRQVRHDNPPGCSKRRPMARASLPGDSRSSAMR